MNGLKCLGPEIAACYIEASPKSDLSNLERPTMQKRFLAATILGVALLFSQGGNFLVAALCPHLRSGMTSCETQVAESPMSHEDMGHIGMEHGSVTDVDPNAISLGQPNGACSHCAVHSRTNSNNLSLTELEAGKRSGDHGVSLHFSRVDPVTEIPVAVFTSRAHGPPGERVSRHILINIFRI